MSKAGDVVENPVTGERAVVRIGTEQTSGELLVVDLYVRPGGAVMGEHLHPAIEERFTVLRGQVGFRLLGRDAIAEPDPDLLDKARERIRLAVAKTEADLEGRDWLAPGGFSLADIAVYAYLAYLPRIAPDLLAPRTKAWLERAAARPAVKAAEAMGKTDDPYGVSAPGPEHIRWG